MRRISGVAQNVISSRRQTQAMGTALGADIRIQRATPLLLTDDFLERIEVDDGMAGVIRDSDIAVAHTRAHALTGDVYIAMCKGGMGYLLHSPYEHDMINHTFDIAYTITGGCAAVAVGFDGEYVTLSNGGVRFRSDEVPYFCWVTPSGGLMRRDPDGTVVEMATENITDVTCIRAMTNPVPSQDMGFVIMAIENGDLVCWQKDSKEWTDKRQVRTAGRPSGTYTKIKLSNTWDYRIHLEAEVDDVMYSIRSVFMGFSRQAFENINTIATLRTPRIAKQYPSFVYAANIPDESDDRQYGTTVELYSSLEIVYIDLGACYMLDSKGARFNVRRSYIDSENSTRIVIEFYDFNTAVGECTIYIPEGDYIESTFGTKNINTEISFVPTDLNPPMVIKVVERIEGDLDLVWNRKTTEYTTVRPIERVDIDVTLVNTPVPKVFTVSKRVENVDVSFGLSITRKDVSDI